MTKSNTWELTKARAEFERVVARALAGAPQMITSRGKVVLMVCDQSRFELAPKPQSSSVHRRVPEPSKKR
jgi:prevent-host-death family protein